MTGNDNVTKRILEEFREYRNISILQDGLSNAIYTKACIQESYRIRPTAFCLARILEEDMNLSGYNLQAGVRFTLTKIKMFTAVHLKRRSTFYCHGHSFWGQNSICTTIV